MGEIKKVRLCCQGLGRNSISYNEEIFFDGMKSEVIYEYEDNKKILFAVQEILSKYFNNNKELNLGHSGITKESDLYKDGILLSYIKKDNKGNIYIIFSGKYSDGIQSILLEKIFEDIYDVSIIGMIGDFEVDIIC